MSLNYRILALGFIALFWGCDKIADSRKKEVEDTIIVCGAEKWDGEHFIDETGTFHLSNANGRTSEVKRTGDYSLKLVEERRYGMTIKFSDVKPDDYFEVTVWRKGNGHICASNDKPEGFYKATNEVVETDSLGWEKLRLEFYVPHNFEGDYLKILLSNFGKVPVFFDDLTIKKSSRKKFPVYDAGEVMNIFISDENYARLKQKRKNALSEGILMTEDDDWVKAIIFYKDQVLDTRMRLKGDRLDHLQGRKWSFRIKVKGNNAWKGMRTFSIQTPSARNFLHEWFFHKALEKEDILCTRYGFVPVLINGESVGVYAWEEHFEKHLIEHRKRREGPILKLSDDSYWIYDKLRRQKELDYTVPFYDASVILPFDRKKTETDSLMMGEFRFGRDLYYQYKYARGKASKIFDVEAAAKYYAMTDATNAYHTLHFFNQRFYYNPALGRLEPIFFDSFADVGIFDYDGTDLVIGRAEKSWVDIHLKLFADPVFKRHYFAYLEKYSSTSFWDGIYAENKNDIVVLNNILGQEFPGYHFDVAIFRDIAAKAKSAMITMKELDKEKDLFSKFASRWKEVNQNHKGKAEKELLPHLINAYKQDEYTYRIENYTNDSVSVLGFSDIAEIELEKLEKKITLLPFNSRKEISKDIKSSLGKHQYVFVEVRGDKYAIPVNQWEAPSKTLTYVHALKPFDTKALPENTEVSNDTLLFNGDVSLQTNMIIPDGWKVCFKPGTKIDLTRGATLLSYSPVFVKGTIENPVEFYSSDNTGKGVNVFQAKQKSMVEHAVFKGLTNMEFGGWLTTGAVCFYESDVDLSHTRFENNLGCDDALNIVRSDYLIENCVFEKTFADAFDSDFCTGQIIASKFVEPGNDALDFSGSRVLVKDCSVIDAGDKAVSCGEASDISITGCTLDGGNIGVASKDKSTAIVEDSMIKNVTYGLVAFCKKPEYGSAHIKTQKVSLKNYLFVHLIEEGSDLSFNNREIFGQERQVAQRFY